MIIAIIGGYLVYGLIKLLIGIRLSEEDEYIGSEVAIHKVAANPNDTSF